MASAGLSRRACGCAAMATAVMLLASILPMGSLVRNDMHSLPAAWSYGSLRPGRIFRSPAGLPAFGAGSKGELVAWGKEMVRLTCSASYDRFSIASVIIFALLTVNTSNSLAQVKKYDGTYAGTQTLMDSIPGRNYSKCLHGPFKRRLLIKDGAATYVYNPTYQGKVVGAVNADGAVSASASTSSGGVSLSGKIDGDDFTGEVWSLICTYSVRLRRIQ
jgi:hypothetical protein